MIETDLQLGVGYTTYQWGCALLLVLNYSFEPVQHVRIGDRRDGASRQVQPADDSPHGCADMGGNVFDRTSTLDKAYPYRADDGKVDTAASGKCVLQGGAWGHERIPTRCASRINRPHTTATTSSGFGAVSPSSPLF